MMRWKHGIPVVLFLLPALLIGICNSAPGLWSDLHHYNKFRLTSQADITNVEYTNWIHTVFQQCMITISEQNRTQILHENRFGRLTSERFVLFQDQTTPTILTTEIGINT